ncbi:hypothetical protein [Ralstonia phage RSF1]|uniref:Uncharacterized protein n=1 Tax=Ralstonia phage RSF1 TaxID=1689679 RepID=A0A0K2QQS8_9CAUD|nr:hypothetical protein AVU11_gp145 [Ralstonia phage RSF1]BAS04937.1 hypothetical protein [Ralstonia phage RSF1]
MSLEERFQEAEQEQRVLITPACNQQDDLDDGNLSFPLSARCYQPLFPVNLEQIRRAHAMSDDKETVMTPMGGIVSLGFANQFGEQILDDVIAVPKFGTNLMPSQIPLMIDEKPPVEHDPFKEHDFGRLPNYTDYCESVEGQAKPVEQVLAIPARELLNAMLAVPEGEVRPNELNQCVYLALNFIRRGWCETDTRFVQLLPYVIFYKKVNGKYQIFVYQRGKGVGEERLALGCSIGVGGHINSHDFLSMQSKYSAERLPSGMSLCSNFTGRMLVDGFWTGILNNLFREGREEIRMKLSAILSANGGDPYPTENEITVEDIILSAAQAEMMSPEQWLYQRTNFFLDYASGDVEKVHLGMFIAIEVPENCEIVTNEEELIDVGFTDLERLYLDNDEETLPTRLECWSRSIVDSLYETIEFVSKPVERVVQSRFMTEANVENGGHYMSPETIAHIPAHDRWKIGTLSGAFDPVLKFYAMNAFLRA